MERTRHDFSVQRADVWRLRLANGDADFAELPVADFRGRFTHEVRAFRRLGERDDVADGGLARENHDHAVEPQGDTAVRRSPVFERVQEEPEASAGLVVAHAERGEDFGLDVAAMNTYGAGAEFDAVEHEIVRFRAATGWVGGQFFDVFVLHASERMMSGNPPFVLAIPFEHGKINHPEETEIGGREKLVTVVEMLAKLDSERTTGFIDRLNGARGLGRLAYAAQEEQVALLSAGAFADLHDGASEITFQPLDVVVHSEAAFLAEGLHIVTVLTAEHPNVRDVDGDQWHAIGGESGPREQAGDVVEGRQAKVWLVDPVGTHHFVVSKAGDGRGDIETGHFAHALNEGFNDLEDLLLLREGHFEVDLSELRLAVGAQVLVTEAADDLKIPVVAAHHEKLLEYLRRLRECVECARLQPARDKEITSPFRGGTSHEGRFDLEKSLFSKAIAHSK